MTGTSCGLTSSFATSTPTLSSGVAECDGAIYNIVYTVTDACGATASCTQSFTLNVAPPTITCPADLTVSCLPDISAGTPTAGSSCGLTNSVSNVGPTLISGAPGCDGAVYSIVYTVTDECDATASCTQTFTLNIPAPTISCPANMTVDCFSAIAEGTPMTNVNCALGSVVSTEGPNLVSGTAECNGAVYEIIYTISDDCGQEASCTQTFTLNVAPPTISCPASLTVTCFSDVSIGTPGFTIACGQTETISTMGPTLTSGLAECDGAIYEISYTIMDECGVSASCTQTYTLDVADPTITCPADLTVSCLSDVLPESPTTTSGCVLGNSVTNSAPMLLSGSAGCNGAVYGIEYTVEDDCSAIQTCTQSFTLIVEEPTIVCAPDQTVNCLSDITQGIPTTTVSCGLSGTVSAFGPYLISGNFGCDGAVFGLESIITDACGQTASCEQRFTLVVEGPTISCPADQTVSCVTDIMEGTPTTTTSCGQMPTITTSGPSLISGMANCTGAVYQITYTVTDNCMETASCVQSFSIDVPLPTINCPADDTVSCFSDIVAGTPTGMASCGQGLSFSASTPILASGSAGCEAAVYEITHTVTDDCGQTASCVQSFTLTVGGPTITCPINLTVDCPDDIVIGTPMTTTTCMQTGTVSTVGPTLTSGLDGCDASTYSVTYTVTDDCGETASCVQMFTLNVMSPTINCPMDLTVTCFSDIVESGPVITTGCMQGSTVTTVGPTLISGLDGCEGAVYELDYTLTDDCGMTASCTQLFTLDVADPTIMCPADVTVSCLSDVLPENPTTTSGCVLGSSVSNTMPMLISGDAGCNGAVYGITYTVVDDCSAAQSCTQEFTLIVSPPTINCPADITVACLSDISQGVPVTTVSCGLNSTVSAFGPYLISGNFGCDGAVYGLESTITDECNQSATCEQRFTLNVEGPTIICPADETVSCFSDISETTPMTTLSCGQMPTITTVGPTLVSGVLNCSGAVYSIEYTVTDNCMMTASCTQNFTLLVPIPTITCPADETVSCFADIMAGTPMGTVSCGQGFMFDASAPVLLSGQALCDGSVYEITHTITDDCGQEASCIQSFTLDVGLPTITCPADLTVSCESDIMIGNATTTTTCMQAGTVTTVGPTLSTGDLGCDNAVYAIVYTVTDACGETASCTQMITLDVAPPTIMCPADETVTCFSDIMESVPITTLSCGQGSVISTVGPTLISGLDGCEGAVYELAYTITDDCGETDDCIQTFTLDVADPTIVCPADLTVACFSNIIAENPTTTSGCILGSSVSSVGPTLIMGNANCDGAVYTIVYTVTDDCSAAQSCTQTFTLAVAAPTIDCPPDETVSCFADIAQGIPTTTVSCMLNSTVSAFGPYLISGSIGCDGSVWGIESTITDECGQVASCVQTFTLDVEEPTIICPADETVNCFTDITIGTPMFTVACGFSSTITTIGPTLVFGVDGCEGAMYEIEYTIEDFCMETASCIQTITIDVPAPTITCPADETVSCFEDIMEGTAGFTTSCGQGGSVATVGPNLASGTDQCNNATYEIIYTVTDECGAIASCTQIFTLNVAPPTISCPADETVSCFGDIMAGTATSTISCLLGGSIANVGPTLISGIDQCDAAVYEIVYTVTDQCGVEASCTQTFTLDVAPPTISCPVDETVSCFDDIAETIPLVTVSCVFGSVITTVGPTLISGTALCDLAQYEIEYTVTDDCGVIASCVQTFTLDVSPPTITCPNDRTVMCFDDVIPEIAMTTASCGQTPVVTTDTPSLISGVDGCDMAVYEIEYTVTDDCGVTASCIQQVTLSIADPTITCPADMTVACVGDIMIGSPTTSSGCVLGSNVTTVGPTLISGVDGCDNAVYNIVYTVTDDCSSAQSCTQTFTLNVAPPTITCPPDETVNCFTDIIQGIPTTTVSCGLNSTVSAFGPFLMSGNNGCDGAVWAITSTITDECGQSDECTQIFTLELNAPVITCPADETVECFADIMVGVPIITTDCGQSSTYVEDGPNLVSGMAECDGAIYEIDYTVTDFCGMISTCTQTFELSVPAPMVTCPADLTVESYAEIVPGIATIITACGQGSTTTFSNPILISGIDGYDQAVYEIIYTVVDDCGATSNCTQTFLLDIPNPTITCPPNAVVACFSDIQAGVATISVACINGSTLTNSGPMLVSGTDLCTNSIYEIEYLVTDNCGQTATCVQSFTLSSPLPTITCPADMTVQCEADIMEGIATFTTSCSHNGAVTTVGPTLISGMANCHNSIYEIEYTFTDVCGVAVNCSQSFMLDIPEPVITSCPLGGIVICSSDIIIGTPAFTTSCGLNATVSHVGPTLIIGAPECDGAIYEIIYTVTDDCGRTDSCSEQYTINGLDPTITSCPPGFTVNCVSNIILDASDITYVSSCGIGASVSISPPVFSGLETCPGTTVGYTYTVTDACGRTTECMRVFTLDPPVLADMQNAVVCSDVEAMSFMLGIAPGSSPAASFNLYSVSADGTIAPSPGSSNLLGSAAFPVNLTANGLLQESYMNINMDQVTISYMIAPVSPDGCEGKLELVTLMVLPETVLTNGMIENVCSDITTGIVLMGSSTSGVLGMIQIVSLNSNGLTGTNIDPLNTDIPANSIADDIWTNHTGVPVLVEYTILPVSDMDCFGDPFMLMLTVDPEPVFVLPNQDRCSDIPLDLALQDFITNGMADVEFTWLAVDNPNTVGESNMMLNYTNFIPDVITNDQIAIDQIVEYNITPTSASGCVGDPLLVEVLVRAEPRALDLAIEVCSEIGIDVPLQGQVDLGNAMTDVSFEWTAIDNPNVSGESFNSTETSISDLLVNNTFVTQFVTYEIIPFSPAGCEGNMFLVEVELFPLPIVTLEPAGPFCYYDPVHTLVGLPVGGIYEGPGVVGNTFTPSLAGGGDHEITYTYVDSNGCVNVATINIYVSPALSVAPFTLGACLGENGVINSNIAGGTAPFNIVWTDLGTGTSSGYSFNTLDARDVIVDSENATVGTINMQVDVEDAIGCITSGTVTYYINPRPTITKHPEDVETCPGATVMFMIEVVEPNVIIEWFGNRVNGTSYVVQGANEATLVIEDVTKAMNGTKFFAKVTLLNGGLGPDCPSYSERACLYVHQGGQMVCNDRVFIGLDNECSLQSVDIGVFVEVDQNLNFYDYRILGINDEPVNLTDSNAPNYISDYVGQCLTFVVEDICTGNTCWGEICIEDKIVPSPNCECETPYFADGITPNPDCVFACYDIYDLEILEEPGKNNEILPDLENNTPEDNCNGFDPVSVDIQIIEGANCGDQIVQRIILYQYEEYDGSITDIECIQQFLFEAIDPSMLGTTVNGAWDGYQNILTANSGDAPIFDMYTPEQVVLMPCGSDISPEGITAHYDLDTPGRPVGKDRDDHDDTPNIIEHNEGYVYAYPYVVIQGWSNRYHPRPIDNNICNMYSVYSDLVYESCAEDCYGNSKIARTWTLLNWCDASIDEFVQTIKRIDAEPPTVSNPDVTISVNPWGCTANYEVPYPEHLHDNCDSDLTWTVMPSVGTEFENGSLLDLAIGEHTFKYIASDCCGNEGSYEVKVTVVDQSPPTAIALENLVLELTSVEGVGIAKLYAVDVDNFSHDGCSDVHFEIRRANSEFNICDASSFTFNNDMHEYDSETDLDEGAYVKFCCDDITEIDGNGIGYGLHDVILRVWDDADQDGIFGSEGDLYNETWATVRVEGKLDPIVVCPANIELSCNQDFNDLELVGRPYATGVCGAIACADEPKDTYRKKPSNQPPFLGEEIPAYNPSCRRGAILREWNCEGKECSQWIIMRDTDNSPVIITWPEDVVLDCEAIETGYPAVVERECELTGVNLESDTFYFEDGACFKILNYWTVINWCDYDASDTDLNELEEASDDGIVSGFYTHTQVIKLIDTEKPILTAKDTCFAVNGECNGIDLQLSAMASDNGVCSSAWLKWKVEVDYWSDWEVDLTYSSFIAEDDPLYLSPTSGEVTLDIDDVIPNSCSSSHRVLWTVADGCGNETSYTSYFTVEDKKDPTPYILNLSTAQMENGQVEIWAKDFDTGSFDNCSASENLFFTFSDVMPAQLLDSNIEDPWYDEEGEASESDYENGDAQQWNQASLSSSRIFDEDDLAIADANSGVLGVEIFVWDECGNSDYALVFLKLISNIQSFKANIAGNVQTAESDQIQNVQIVKTSSNGTEELMTDAQGKYFFSSNPMYVDYSIKALKTDDWLNGVTTLDLVLMQRHILGIEELNSPYNLIAADVNSDQKISAIDLIHLRKLILGIYDALPDNDSWRFVDKSESMHQNHPWPFTESLELVHLSDDEMQQDFTGIKIGDVNQSVISNLDYNEIELRALEGSLDLNIKETKLANGLVKLSFRSSDFDEIYGFQFTLLGGFEEVVEIQKGAIDLRDEHFALTDEKIRFSWSSEKMVTFVDEELFSLIVEKSDVAVSLTNKPTKSEIYKGSQFEILGLNLTGSNSFVTQLLQNEPNPWKSKTIVSFELEAAEDVLFKIYTADGKVLFTQKSFYEAGIHSINLEDKDISYAKGILYYSIESDLVNESKRMIIID